MNIEEVRSDLLQETVYSTLVNPGLRVFVWPKKEYQRTYAVFTTHYGSIDSTFTPPGGEVISVPDGIAHFLEHKLFEKEDGDVFHKFADLGASANAYTSYDVTSYLFSATSNLRENLEVLLDFVQEPYFSPESVEKEQGIIEQEVRMYEDHPGYRVYQNLMQALYHRNPVRIDIAGTVESIRRIDKDLLYLCYETFYHPSNMAVMVVGDVEPRAIMEQVAANVQRHGHRPATEIRRIRPDEPVEVKERRVEDRLTISQPRLLLGFKDPADMAGREMLRRDLATSMMWRMALGRSSELYNRLYEQGLIDDRFSARYSCAPDYAFSVVGGETDDPARLEEALLSGLAELSRTGFDNESLERSRRTLVGQFLDAFNSLEFIAGGFVGHSFRGTSLLDYLEIAREITLEELNERLREHTQAERMAVSVLLPRDAK